MAAPLPLQQPQIHERLISWAPEWAVTSVLLVIAVGGALAIHYFLERLLRRLTQLRRPVLFQAIDQTRSVTRLALVLLALHLVLPSLTLTDEMSATAHNILTACVILLVGWVAMVVANIATDLYLRRFRLDVADNLLARKSVTQMRVLRRLGDLTIILITLGLALMTFPSVREFGVSLFASAGVAGIVAGLAARPVLENLLAGVQIALTQPIRIDDAVLVEGEMGWIEEINSAYVVIKLWDWRRLVVPLSHFIEHPFQNWTRSTASLLGSVLIHLDYSAPVAALRAQAEEIVRASKLWDGGTVNVQVSDATEETIELRVLASARNAPQTWDLRCEIREKLIAFVQEHYPEALPRRRVEQHVSRDTAELPRPRARERADVRG